MPVTGLYTLITNLRSFDIDREQTAIFQDNREQLADIMAAQLAQGKDKSGNVRDDEYEPITVRYKKELGQGLGSVTDRVTFYMTGRLYSSLFAEVAARTVQVKSPLETYDKMIKRIGEQNFGYSPQSVDEIRSFVRPSMKTIIKRKIGLNVK